MLLITLAVLAYSTCSGSLLLVNKVLMTLIPAAPLVTAIQCLFCIVAIGGCAVVFGQPRLGVFPPPSPILRAYALYSGLFVIGIYTNMKALAATNVDTVIVFRSAVPLVVAFGEWAWMGREAPSKRSLAALLAVVAGSAAFVMEDAEFRVTGLRAYAWSGAYMLCIASEMLFGKHMTSNHEVTLATSVLLTNAFALLPFLAIGASTGELSRGLDAAYFTPTAIAVLVASCLLSAGIGFSSWWARSLLSATTFTVIGTVNKILTVLLNVALWNKHASALGTFFLLVCIAGGSAYQQAPMRVGRGGGAGAGGKGEAEAAVDAGRADDRDDDAAAAVGGDHVAEGDDERQPMMRTQDAQREAGAEPAGPPAPVRRLV